MVRSRTLVGIGSLLGVLGMMLCGCDKGEAPPDAAKKTPPVPAGPVVPKLAIKLPPEIAGMKAEGDKGIAQIDLVLTSLDATVAAADADPKPAYQKLKKDLDGLNAQAATIRSRGDAMKSKGKSYFAAWEEQLAGISTPEIKTAAAARKDELSKYYDGILADMAKTREGYDKFASFLGDISKVMENDLNAQGLRAIAPKVAQAKEMATEVKGNVGAVLAEIDKIAAIYSPGK